MACALKKRKRKKQNNFLADSWLMKLAICIFIRNFEMLNEELENGKHCYLFVI